MRRTKIVATIGPASDSVEQLVRLIEAGMNCARLNFSHGEHAEHGRRLANIREARQRTGQPVSIMVDLKGPEIRLGTFAGGRVTLQEGQTFVLDTQPRTGDITGVFVGYPHRVKDVVPGKHLLMDDGNIRLEVVATDATTVTCRVVVGGELSDRKKLNMPGVHVSLPALSDKDTADIRFAVQNGVDFVAASFVRKAADVIEVRRVIEEAGGDQEIIAKVENQEGIDNLEEILQVVDGFMVARGDLGVECPLEEMPPLQKRMIERCNQLGKPVITATQMLESMVTRPRPTRAEVSDVANAIYDGSDCVMLSAESAVGQYPVDTVRTMARICEVTEEALDYTGILNRKRRTGLLNSVTEAISHATVSAAADLGAAAIVTATKSGFTARMVSKYRPRQPVIAVTPLEQTRRRLSVVWGVTSVLKDETHSTDLMIERALEGALESGIVQPGDLVALTAGVPVGIQGTTNLLQVRTVSEVLVRGTGIGRKAVTGPARLVSTTADLERVQAGDIIVTNATDAEAVPAMERAAGIVTEEGGLTSHGAVAGLSLGKPVVVGAHDARQRIRDGEIVTIDSMRGLVYRGRATVK